MVEAMRLVGPPGTGKTTSLARYVGREAEERGSDAILVTSFTRAAAVELAGRDMPISPGSVGTLHAVCYRALGRPTIAETKIGEWNAARPQYALSGDDDGLDEPSYEVHGHTESDELLGQMNRLRGMMVPRDMWATPVAAFARAWDGWKADAGYIDFTDMLERALQEFDVAPGAPEVLIGDEMQDSTPLMLAVMRQWARGCEKVVWAADPDQMLYGWIGCTPASLAIPICEGERRHVLPQSYRVPRAVHAISQAWIRQLGARRQEAEYRPRDADGVVRRSGALWPQPETLLDDVEEHARGGKTAMILASCGYMLHPLLAVMRHRGVPFGNRYRRRNHSWNPLNPSHGTPAKRRILSFLRPQVSAHGERAEMWRRLDLEDWLPLVREDAGRKRGALKLLAEQPDAFQPSLEWLQAHALEDSALGPALDGDVGWLHASALQSKAKALEYPIRVLQHAGAVALADEPPITVGTIHSVKGGEADTVYMFPDLSLPGQLEWDAGGEGHDGIVRMAYVGMTRAREQLVLYSTAYDQRLSTAWGRLCG